MADLEIQNLHVNVEGKEILKGRRPGGVPRRGPCADGPERLRQVHAREHDPRSPELRDHRGQDPLPGRGRDRGRARRARPRRPLHGVPVPVRDPGRVGRELPAHGDQRAPQGARRGPDQPEGVPQDARGAHGGAGRGPRVHPALPERGLLGRREEALRDPPDGDPEAARGGDGRDRLGARHRRAADGRERGQRDARPGPRRPDHHPLPAHPELHQARLRPHHAERADRRGGRPRAGRPSWSRRATSGCASCTRRRSRPRWRRRPHRPPRSSVEVRTGLPDPRARGRGAAARLPRQRRDGAEAGRR